MTLNSLPDIGVKIEIELLTNSLNLNQKQLISQVIDIVDENLMFLSMPIINKVVIPLPINELINVKYGKKNGGQYSFKAKVLDRKKTDTLSYFKVKRIGEIIKLQRRNFFRLEVVRDCQIMLLGSQENKDKTIRGVTTDISGGGLSILVNDVLETGSLIQITIYTDKTPIKVQGKVLRCFSNSETNYKYTAAIVFENIDEKVRTQIVSFIFDYQRNMKKKGLI